MLCARLNLDCHAMTEAPESQTHVVDGIGCVFIERASSPTDFAMFHPTNAVHNPSFLHVQNVVALF